MSQSKNATEVGAPDPEYNTSPIAEESNDDTEILRSEVPGEPVCYFNDKRFATGDFIKSGTSLLKCDYGIWIPAGPDNADIPKP